ncbi:ArgE/DapE family deacylase [Lentibacillus cibarius]|uniref:Probable succinyl-diaminopimelate desuccinylase n=1 Tax=Lentibacillus cibarius TaxID=2583219 RepID=A0A5S3QKI5_9BACI|nr:ArgE/DapE family deacylase [Lentibacillus cibarius]TMN21711.1 ArgE/DapE family deacylase [Lentibacillus cibarius]
MDRQFSIDKLKEILRINTANPPGNEEDVAKNLRYLFESYGIETELVPHSEGRVNLIANLRGRNTKKFRRVLGLSGHMDVVPPGDVKWDYNPYAADEVDGKIYARGACDMKSGLMSCVMAMITLKEEDVQLDGDIKLLASVGEETGAVGAKQLVDEGYAEDLDALIIAEPSGGDIVVSHKGAFWTQITCYGKTAHGSRPHHGINAVLHIHEIINQILSEDFQLKYEPDPLLGEPTYSINVINGGSNTNVVPDQCSVNIDFRTVPSQDHQDIIDELNRVIETVRKQYPELKADISILNNLAPLNTQENDPFVHILQEVLQERTSELKEPKGMTGYTDSSQFMKALNNFPIIVWSTIDGKTAHQPNEYVEIEKYLKGIDLFKAIAQKYL